MQQPIGKLESTNRTVNVSRAGKRREFKDSTGQLWVKVFGQWWKFPQQIEY